MTLPLPGKAGFQALPLASVTLPQGNQHSWGLRRCAPPGQVRCYRVAPPAGPCSGGLRRSTGRVRKLVRGITDWHPTSSPGREVAPVPESVPFVRPLIQYAVRTPSKEQAGGYYHAIVFSTCTELTMEHYDGRAGMEADLKGDNHSLGLAAMRKQRLPAQKIVVLLMQLAHNVLIWARRWLTQQAPRLRGYGIVRLIHEI